MRVLMILAGFLLLGAAQAAHQVAADFDTPAPRYQSEWWQLNASLTGPDGRLWGLEWSLYRQHSPLQGSGSSLQAEVISLAHVAITTPDGEYLEQRFEHGEFIRAGNGSPANVLLDGEPTAGWEWVSQGASLFPARLSFRVGDRDLNLLLDAPVAAANASEQIAATVTDHVASDPLLRVRGFVDQGATKTYLRGQGRLDREWQAPRLAVNLPVGN